MDYHKKVIAATVPSQKCKNEDDEDDLEALRLAALQTLRVKDALNKNKRRPTHQNRGGSFQGSQSSRSHYNQSRGDHFLHRQQRQNGVRHNFFPKNIYRNPNLIEIVPQGEIGSTSASKENIDTQTNQSSSDGSKFQRYKDNASGSEDDEAKDIDSKLELKTEEKESAETEETATDKENESDADDSSKDKTAEEVEEDRLLNDDDDDVLLMADLEEEDSLERLMDEMEREIKDDKIDITDKKLIKREKSSVKKIREQNKQKQEVKVKEDIKDKIELPLISKSTANIAVKPDQKPPSPRLNFKKRSVSPKPRSWRKASPRRSPKRSPPRLLKSIRETSRYRSPRKSPLRYSPRSPRFSPRPKSPRISPPRSPNRRSPDRRSPLPLRKLSPKGRSPRLSPRSRSPRIRSRSSRSRSRSPRRSPRKMRSRSPRYSPHRYSPRSRTRSPRSRSPRSPRRRISRSRSPRSPRRGSPRHRSPRLRSPKRLSPRYRSPRLSPRRSPWSSPRRSPRMSPKRLRSPRRSPKDSTRRPRTKSLTPEKQNYVLQNKDTSLSERKSPEMDKGKTKKEGVSQKTQASEVPKEEPVLDPILEARRRKFESVTPIDPINANKTIKLSNKKEEVKKPDIKKPEIKQLEIKKIEIKRLEPQETVDEPVEKRKKLFVTERKEQEQEVDLLLDTTYDFEEMEEDIGELEEEIQINTKEVSLQAQAVNQEKKKKKDKEIYQIGKMKGEMSIPERIKKEKFKKRKIETVVEGASEVEKTFEDTTVDEEGDLRAELSRRRAERLNRSVPMQSARLLQSAFKGVVNEVAKNNAKINQRLVIKGDDKPVVQKEVRRVTVLHRTLTDFDDSKEETSLETKVPVRLRLGVNKSLQETRETKVSRKALKKQGRKVKHKNSLPLDSSNLL